MAIRDSIVGAIQSGQMAVGSALTGGGAAVADSGSGAVPLLEDLRSISRENEGNTERLTNVLRDMFAFDKNRFARERDQAREVAKEKREVANATGGGVGIPSAAEMTGGLGPAALAGIASLAYFAKELGMNTDILKLPQQLKSISAMGKFAAGIGTIGTAGFGPAIVRDIKLVVGQFGTNISNAFKTNIAGPILKKFDDFKLKLPKSPFGGAITFFDNFTRPIKNFFKSPTMIGIGKYFDEAAKSIGAVFAPFKKAFMGLFGSAKEGGKLAGILKPLQGFGRAVGKLFLPVTLILGIFDGVSGFMKEYEDTGSIVDGIRGAVVGIVDGFIGSFVRLITDLVGMALSFLGLDNLGSYVTEFGEKITGNFSEVIGGLVDVITGIFTLDIGRVWDGIKGVAGGMTDFFFNIVSAPIDLAVNFLKDIFNFGDPDKPFSLKDFFLGEDGPVMSAWNWFKGLFTFDFTSLKEKLFNMGTIFKGLAAGGVAAAKAILPGGESPGEAFKRVFESYTKGNDVSTEPPESQADIAKTIVEDVQGNTTETTYKTEQLNDTTNNNQGNITYVDNSNKQNQNIANSKNETYTGSLNTGIDPYHDRLSLYGIG